MNLITINLTAADAVSIASLINATAAKDSLEVLEQVRIVPGLNGELYALGTNRYVAAQFKITRAQVTGELPDTGIGLSAAACKFITTNVKRVNKWNTPDRVELIANTETREISVRHGAAVIGDTWAAGNYPVNLLSMVESWEPAPAVAPVNLGTQLLATLGKFIDSFTKVEAWTLELGAASSELARERGYAGPLRATAGNFTALIQPRVTK